MEIINQEDHLLIECVDEDEQELVVDALIKGRVKEHWYKENHNILIELVDEDWLKIVIQENLPLP
jgi:hypothetical protein